MSQATVAPTPRRYHPLWNLTVARLREYLREPRAIFWSYAFPLLLVATLGTAFRSQPAAALRIAVVRGPEAECVLAQLKNQTQFRASLCDEQEAQQRFRAGRADLVLTISAEEPHRYDYRFDPSRSQSVLARRTVDDSLQRAAGRQDVAEVHDHATSEPGSRYADFLVPGLLGMTLMMSGVGGVGHAVVDMRVRRLLKHYFAMPVKHSHFLAAIMVSRFLFTAMQVVLLLVCAHLLFGVSSQGGYVGLTLVAILGALAFSGIGLLLGSRAQTMETLSGMMSAIMLPMWIGSGIFFSTERFPELVQSALLLLPLTPLIHALRSSMLEGASLPSLGGDLALISLWGCAAFVLALRWFRWK